MTSITKALGKLLRWMWHTERRFSSRYDDRREHPICIEPPFHPALMRFYR